MPPNKTSIDNSMLFLRSALTLKNPFNSTEQVIAWLKERNEKVKVKIESIAFSEMTQWIFDVNTGSLRHVSGKFFSIEGINVKTNCGCVPNWDQPIINQPEIGILGIIAKEFDSVLYFLMQAKVEPGNVNFVQISPTLQATKSNYTQVHQGNPPAYLNYFQALHRHKALLDQLQSEQGARFIKKRNRNIIIQVHDNIEVLEDFCWLTLGQIKELMKYDNLVNMDTRTVISCIPYGNHSSDAIKFYHLLNDSRSDSVSAGMLRSELDFEVSLYTFDEIIHWFTNLKTIYDLSISPIRLNEVRNWRINEKEICHEDGKFFRVIAVNVEISNREVKSWHQPLIEPAQNGICAFVVKEIRGVLHFLVQAKLECGNFDILEMAPTVQCLTGNYTNEDSLSSLPFLRYVLNSSGDSVFYDSLQSEEGGRFFREQNRNMIILADESFPLDVPHNYVWMTLNQLKTFIKFNNYINIQARSLISLISFI